MYGALTGRQNPNSKFQLFIRQDSLALFNATQLGPTLGTDQTRPQTRSPGGNYINQQSQSCEHRPTQYIHVCVSLCVCAMCVCMRVCLCGVYNANGQAVPQCLVRNIFKAYHR